MSDQLLKKLGDKITRLEENNPQLKAENEYLRARVEYLEAELKKYQRKKTSSNSSKPPSQDIGESSIRRKSLREKSGRKPGGQFGHKGNTLLKTETPDEIFEHSPNFCNYCGLDLSEKEKKIAGRYQEVEIPPMNPVFTEHRFFEKKCSCGAVSGEVPAHRDIVYGNRIKAFVAYLSIRQYVPIKRIQELLNNLLGVFLSEGSICSFIDSMCDKSTKIYEAIRDELEASEGFVGSDETGFKINGKNHWAWTWQNERNTYIALEEKRGLVAVEKHFSKGFSRSTLVHDRWSAQINTRAGKHQLCLAHLMRDCQYAVDLGEGKWAGVMKKLLKRAIFREKEMGEDVENRKILTECMGKRLDRLLSKEPEGKESLKLYKSLKKHRGSLLVFIEETSVPPTNNSSEQAIRNIKLKQKVSGSMRTLKGAQNFCKLRSVIDTAVKRGSNVIQTLFNIMALHSAT